MSYKVDIIYKNVKNIKISVNSTDLVTVISPLGVSKKEILNLLQEKRSWIDRQLKRLQISQRFNYLGYKLDDGDRVYFLGRQYPIKIVESRHNIVTFNNDHIKFLLNASVINNREFKLQLLEEFYKDQADIILNNLVAKYLKITNQEINRLVIKKTKTRWGSCNYVKKNINLNWKLILRDIQAIEYVVLHEIAHLTHPNHSKDFYEYISKYMPDWKMREKSLK